MSPNDLAEVTIDFKGFGHGKTQNSDTALVRPFKLLLDEGKPIGRINYLFYRSNRSFVLGSLCYAPGRRLLYFPGLIARTALSHTRDRIREPLQQPFLIDHLTLEPDFRSFHVTTLRHSVKRHPLQKYSTRKVQEGVIQWFGLSLHSENALEECPEEVRFQFSSPPQDSDRRLKIVMESREDARFRIIEQNPGTTQPSICFLHFDFYLDMREGAVTQQGWGTAPSTAPRGPPLLKETPTVAKKIPIRVHHVDIPSFPGLVSVIASMQAGELTDQALLGVP